MTAARAAVLVSSAALLLCPAVAHAAYCYSTFVLDADTEYAVLGESGGVLAVCQRLYNGNQIFTTVSGCNTSTLREIRSR
jgi:hypothetical protein